MTGFWLSLLGVILLLVSGAFGGAFAISIVVAAALIVWGSSMEISART